MTGTTTHRPELDDAGDTVRAGWDIWRRHDSSTRPSPSDSTTLLACHDSASSPVLALPVSTGDEATCFDVDEARRLYGGGASCRQIADRLGVSRSYVSARLRRAGTPMRPPGRPHNRHDLDTAELVRLRDSGATWPQVAATFGVTRYAARQHYLRSVLDADDDLQVEDVTAAQGTSATLPARPSAASR